MSVWNDDDGDDAEAALQKLLRDLELPLKPREITGISFRARTVSAASPEQSYRCRSAGPDVVAYRVPAWNMAALGEAFARYLHERGFSEDAQAVTRGLARHRDDLLAARRHGQGRVGDRQRVAVHSEGPPQPVGHLCEEESRADKPKSAQELVGVLKDVQTNEGKEEQMSEKEGQMGEKKEEQTAEKLESVGQRLRKAVSEGIRRAPVEVALEEGQAAVVKMLLAGFKGTRHEKEAVKKFLIWFFSTSAGQAAIAGTIAVATPLVAGVLGRGARRCSGSPTSSGRAAPRSSCGKAARRPCPRRNLSWESS